MNENVQTVASSSRIDRELIAEERFELRRAKRLLEGTGLSLTEAVKLAMEQRGNLHSAKNSALIDDAIDAYLKRALAMKLREQTYDFYACKLGMFSRSFPGKHLDEITRPEIRAWLDAQPVTRLTARGTMRAVHALYAWARSCEPPLCRINACEYLRVEIPRNERTPSVLNAAEVAHILNAAGPFRWALAIMVFAGVRPHEIAGRRKPRLTWAHVDRAARVIRIPAEIAKTRKPRAIEGIPQVLWDWLADAPADGPICRPRVREATRAAWAALQTLRRELTRWPSDVLRHTAASYLLALWQDAGRVALALGHEGNLQMLYVHYRAVMTRLQAQAIASVRPENSRIVSFTPEDELVLNAS